MLNYFCVFLTVVLFAYFGIMYNGAEGIQSEDKIIIVLGKNSGEPDIHIAKKIKDGLHDSNFQNVHIRIDELVSDVELSTSNVIIIGGVAINQVTRDLLDELKLQFYEIPQPPTMNPGQNKKWAIVNTETKKHYASGYSDNHGLGFIYNLHDSESSRHLFVIAGIEAKGTHAASEYFFGQKCFDKIDDDVEFVIVNSERDQDKQDCAKIVDLGSSTESSQKIFESQPKITKTDLLVTKTIKSNNVEKIAFYPNDEFEIEIKLKNNSDKLLTYNFEEFIPSYLLLNNFSPSECMIKTSGMDCQGSIGPNETMTINYGGTISPNAEPGNWVLERTTVDYYLNENSNNDAYDFNIIRSTEDPVIRIHPPINTDIGMNIKSESVTEGSPFDVTLTLTNNGLESFFANGTVSITQALEFADNNNKNKSSADYNFSSIYPKETKEIHIKLRAKNNSLLLFPEKQTIQFTPFMVNTIYNGTTHQITPLTAGPVVTKDILLLPQHEDALMISAFVVFGLLITGTTAIFSFRKKKQNRKNVTNAKYFRQQTSD